MEGRILAQRYRLVSQLRQGGMGSVWRAEHIELATPAAIKLIDPSVADGPTALARFKREAQAAAALRSPHVVQILDYGVDEGTPYIAMELLDGENLADRLERLGSLTPQATSEILTQVARAVGKGHAMGIIHRDLKPDNIFLVRNEDVETAKVLDFGIAKSTQRVAQDISGPKTETGTFVGTPYYMSPEQMRAGHTITHTADLWSLGVVAYECILGARPFCGGSLIELVVAICTDPPPVPSEHGAVPPGFDEWFARCVARDPTQRFESAMELAVELRAICGLGGTRPSWAESDESQTTARVSEPPAAAGAETGASPDSDATLGATAEQAKPTAITLSGRADGMGVGLALAVAATALLLVGFGGWAVYTLATSRGQGEIGAAAPSVALSGRLVSDPSAVPKPSTAAPRPSSLRVATVASVSSAAPEQAPSAMQPAASQSPAPPRAAAPATAARAASRQPSPRPAPTRRRKPVDLAF